MNKLILLYLLFFGSAALAQTSYPFIVAKDRMLFHDNVDREQRKLLKDGTVQLSKDESINLQIEDAMIRRLDDFQEQIENDSSLTGNDKKKYLRGLEFMLRGFNQNWNKKDFS